MQSRTQPFGKSSIADTVLLEFGSMGGIMGGKLRLDVSIIMCI